MAGITGAPQNRENRSKLGWGGRLNGVIGVPKLHPLAGRLHHLEFALPVRQWHQRIRIRDHDVTPAMLLAGVDDHPVAFAEYEDVDLIPAELVGGGNRLVAAGGDNPAHEGSGPRVLVVIEAGPGLAPTVHHPLNIIPDKSVAVQADEIRLQEVC